MARLLFMLAWAECRHAEWLLAAGDGARAAHAMALAFARLGGMPAAVRPRAWRPLVAGARHGLRVVPGSRRPG